MKNSKIIIIVLAVLLVLSIGYSVYTKIDNTKFVTQLSSEKDQVKSELDSMIAQYDVQISKNTVLNDDLVKSRAEVVAIRDSLMQNRKVNYAAIRKLKSKLAKLEKLNKHLFFLVDSTKQANARLALTIDSTQVLVELKDDTIKNLVGENIILSKNIENGSALQLTALSANGVKLKSNGKLLLTTKASRADRIRVCAVVTKNVLAAKADREFYVQIFSPDGKLLGANETIALGDESINYSEKANFFYQNIDTQFCVLSKSNTNKGLLKGTYKIKVFGEGRLLGQLDLNLR